MSTPSTRCPRRVSAGTSPAVRNAAGPMPVSVVLVIDAATGQNGLNQALEFNEALGLDGIIMTKLDGTAKGGIAMAVAEKLANIPDDVQLYVYCYTGQTASQTTALLNVAGKFATNVQGGYNNGISATEGFEKYVTTEAGPELTTDTYTVDPDVQAAITAYYTDMVSKAGTTFANNNFAPDSLKEVIDAEMDDYFIYSVRQAVDFEAGHIQGAVNNPFGAGMEQNFAAQLPMDKKIIVYCYTGQTASQTTAILRLLGYDADNLSGGMGKEGGAGWLGKGYAVTTD